jgi:DNA polymerase III alpha subunit
MKYCGFDVDLNSKEVYDFLCKGKNLKGIFQLETPSASRVLQQIKPKNIEDLSLVNSLNRPGSMGFTKDITAIRNGLQDVEYLDKSLEPFLKDTYGKLVFQESVLKIAQQLAGFKATESNALLKALGKKKMDVMQSLQSKFIEGMKKNGYSEDFSIKLFSWFEAFANYSFNKSHASSYSLMGYISAYIKYHHPREFFCSQLNFCQYEQKPMDEIYDCASEFYDFGIQMLPPSVKTLENKFTIKDGAIQYPVGLIRSVGDAIFEKLATLNQSQLSKLDNFLESVINLGINNRSMNFIIISGALDYYGVDREDVLFYYSFLYELQPEVLNKFWVFKNGNDFSRKLIFDFLNFKEEVAVKLSKKATLLGEKKFKNKSFFKTEVTRVKTLEKITKLEQSISLYKEKPHIARFFWETHVLGYSSNFKLNNFLSTFRDLENLPNKATTSICGFIEEVIFRTSAKGNDYAIVKLKFDIKRDFMLFGEVCEGAKELIKEGDFLRLKVTRNLDNINVDAISIGNNERKKYEFYTTEKLKKQDD